MNKYTEAVLIITSSGLVFGCIALFRVFSIQGFVMGCLFGFYLGFAALPFFEPTKWAPQYLWCGLLGGLAATSVAMYRTENIQWIILSGCHRCHRRLICSYLGEVYVKLKIFCVLLLAT